MWVGSDDGLVHVSQDDGKTWQNVTSAIPDFPDWGTVRCIEPSTTDAGTAYVVADAHRLNDFRPYLWKTSDFGKTWQDLAAKLPQDIQLHAVRTDPAKKGMLYVGTERGVAYSNDDGETWQPLKLKLPTMAVHDLQVKGSALVLATMGRSIWIIDDLTPIRELMPKVTEPPDHLFAVQPATRWRLAGGFSHTDRGAADNPPFGAVIHYFIAKKPAHPVKLEVLDPKGQVLVTFVGKDDKEKEKEEEKDKEDEEAADGPEVKAVQADHLNRARRRSRSRLGLDVAWRRNHPKGQGRRRQSDRRLPGSAGPIRGPVDGGWQSADGEIRR